MFNPHEYYTQLTKIMQTNEPKFIVNHFINYGGSYRSLAFFESLSVIYYLIK
jgi:hypothetical protein